MGQAHYSIKLFTVPAKVHKTNTIRTHRFYHHFKRQQKLKGDNDSAGSKLLEKIAFIAEFTFSCKLGYFHFYGRSYNPSEYGFSCCALKTEKFEKKSCRSPPLFWFLQKIKTEVSI